MRIQGAWTALVTPMRSGKVDVPRLEELVEEQVKGGIDGLVPCGTTGEAPTLSLEEHELVVKTTVAAAKGRVPVMAGCGSNDTHKAIELTKLAKRCGAQAALHVMPYYNKPTQDGLVAHVAAILKDAPMPTVVYNVPTRTVTDLLPETIARMARELPDVVGVKEASGNVLRSQKVTELVGERLAVLSGDDAMTLPILSVGGVGVVSVTSNLAPGRVAEVCRAWAKGDLATAKKTHFGLLPLHEVLFVETSPAPVKAALQLLGKMDDEVRLPLVRAGAATRDKLASVLRAQGMLA
jgi:4-hydroxy-tetrahydrodipicolinate synthase